MGPNMVIHDALVENEQGTNMEITVPLCIECKIYRAARIRLENTLNAYFPIGMKPTHIPSGYNVPNCSGYDPPGNKLLTAELIDYQTNQVALPI